MRYAEPRLVDDLVPVEEQVEIDGPRAETGAVARSAERTFDREQPGEQLAGPEVGLQHHGRVQKARLILDSHRVRLSEARDGEHLDCGIVGEVRDRAPERRLAVAQVRAEADVRPRHERAAILAMRRRRDRPRRRPLAGG